MNRPTGRKVFTVNPITKFTLLITRDNGTEAKIVAMGSFGIDGLFYTSADVFRRDSSSEPWRMCSDRPHPDWLTMSVDDCNAYGRQEVLQTVTTGEILKAAQWLGRDIRDLPDNVAVAA